MHKTKAHKVNWDDPNWRGSVASSTSIYAPADITYIENQSPNMLGSKRSYLKGVYFRSDNGLAETAVFIVSLNGALPMLTNNDYVAKPCPPMCGEDGP